MKTGIDETYVPAESFKTDNFKVSKELYGKLQPLTNNVATKVMMFASTMIAAPSCRATWLAASAHQPAERF